MKENKRFNKRTSYQDAVYYLNNKYILCNNIVDIDESIWEELSLIEDELQDTFVFQYFLSDCTREEVEFLTEHFDNVYFVYSRVLDLYVLYSTHYGTSWNRVCTYTDLDFSGILRPLEQ